MQCGFRALRSTTDHLVRLEGAIQDAFLRNQPLFAVFFDLEKAYDTTCRQGILLKLRSWGVVGNLSMFVKNFLDNRVFRVRVGNSFSTLHVQKNGVPQGSVLSVTLFAIAIDGIVTATGNAVRTALYVDDFAIFIASSRIALAERRLQLAVDRIAN